MEKKYPIDDWDKYIPQMSNIQNRTGISIVWQKLWAEIENWYGDIKKHETGEQFLKRMQATYFTSQGIGWVKGSERLPNHRDNVIVRGYLNEQGYTDYRFVAFGHKARPPGNETMYFEYGSRSFLTNDIEWLDEGQLQPVEDK